DSYATKRRIRDSLEAVWQEDYALAHFTASFPTHPFTLNGKALKHSDALADMWMPHVGSLYAGLLGMFTGSDKLPDYLKGIGNLGLHLHADQKQLRFDGKLDFEGKQGSELLQFYQQKMNPKLL